MLAVFDVDGVVADVRHRLHHVVNPPKSWTRFFAGAADDPPLETGVELARRWSAEHDIVWLTGRPESLRRVTERWLRDQGLPARRVLMRPTNDRRPARLYKAERLAELAKRSTIAVVVDDDPDVVALLRAKGFPVYLADWVPYADAMRQAQESDGRT